MNDHVVDTSVLLVASAAHPFSPFDDTHIPLDHQRQVLDWLVAFRADAERNLVLDGGEIYKEYRNKLTDQDYGLQVVHEKMQTCRIVLLSLDENGHALVPPAFSSFDPSDRKLLAAALVDPETISIVNATDTDWLEIEGELQEAQVTVIHVLDAWLCRSKTNRE